MSESKELKATPVTMTAEALQQVIATTVSAAIQESKKPAPLTDVEKNAIEQDNLLRLETSNNVLAQMQAKKFEQRSCIHKHTTGESHGVYITDGNYVLCQKCQAKIRPSVPIEAQLDKNSIYDTDLFNRAFQEISRSDM